MINTLPRFIFILLTGLTTSVHSAAQELLYEVTPEPSFLKPLADGVSDIDADGHGDFIVANKVYSGADASVLLSFEDLPAPLHYTKGIGDVNADGVPDIVLGILVSFQESPIWFMSGANGDLIGKGTWFFHGGDSMEFLDAGPDADGDGLPNVLFGGIDQISCNIGSAAFLAPPPAELGELLFSSTMAELGELLFSSTMAEGGRYVGDVNGDGLSDALIVTTQDYHGQPDRRLVLYSHADGVIKTLAGRSLDGFNEVDLGDFNGDGAADLLCDVFTGYDGCSKVAVLSGTDLSTLLELDDFGSMIGAPGDINCDGTPDFLIADANATITRLLSGLDQSVLWQANVYPEHIEKAGDVNADGIPDWLMQLADGTVQVWAGPGPRVESYCVGKPNSANCTPQISTSGHPTAQGPDNFVISTRNSLVAKPGLFFWGTQGATEAPFLGATLCVSPPLTRGPISFAQGLADCEAGYVFHASQSWAQQNNFSSGTTINGQFWMRDPDQADGTGTGLSNAIEFVWCE